MRAAWLFRQRIIADFHCRDYEEIHPDGRQRALLLYRRLKLEEHIPLFVHDHDTDNQQQPLKHSRVLANLISHLASALQEPAQADIEPAERFLLYPALPELLTLKII